MQGSRSGRAASRSGSPSALYRFIRKPTVPQFIPKMWTARPICRCKVSSMVPSRPDDQDLGMDRVGLAIGAILSSARAAWASAVGAATKANVGVAIEAVGGMLMVGQAGCLEV